MPPYLLLVVLILKPNGNIRLCIGYRKLHAITVAYKFLMEYNKIHMEWLHEAKHTSYTSTLDLHSGFHQVQVYSPNQDKTALVCPFETYHFIKMPFGLKNVPATLQRLIH